MSEAFTYARVLGASRVIVVANPSESAVRVSLTLGTLAGKYKQLSNARAVTLAAKQVLDLPAFTWQVYTTK